MKQKLAMMLIVVGAAISFFFDPVSYADSEAVKSAFKIGYATVGMFLLGSCFVIVCGNYKGTIWGGYIKAPTSLMVKQIFAMLGLLIGGYSLGNLCVSFIAVVFSFNLVSIALIVVPALIFFFIGLYLTIYTMNKTIAKSTYALSLGDLTIFKEIDANIGEATRFVVSFEGVALMNSANYCYAVFLYENYQLGELNVPEEVALVGTYFMQKYGKDFKYKVDMEVIPGEPGQTAVAFGAGGIAIARTSGTKDQRLFRSYIFTRK